MRRAVVALASLALLACTGSTSQAPAATSVAVPTAGSVEQAKLTVGGVARTYALFRPLSLDSGAASPLVVVLHPCNPSRRVTGYLVATTSHLDDQATAGKFIAAYPDGQDGCWNAGTCCTSADDVAFISSLIDRLASTYPIDRSRVFVTGFSFGASMAYRIACELASKVAAIASVSGAMVFDDCRPSRPVSILVMHGTKDATFPYAGGGDYGVPSVATVMQRWVGLEGCSGGPVQSQIGHTQTITWDRCKAEAVVRADIVLEGSHTWFGLAPASPPGEPSASAAVWDFFSRVHPAG